jgi:NADPH:quinone reductase-like Zn-dependent oxidoreductase
MHAIVCPDVMKYEEIAKPEPAAGEVLIKAEAIGVIFKERDRIVVEFQRKQY